MADWDETSPGDSDFISQFPTDERAARSAVKTNFGVDHHETDDSDVGKHKKVTLLVQGSDPSNASGQGVFYTKTSGGEVELFYRDASGTVVPLTAASLRSISGLTPAADRGIYFTSSSAASLWTLTSFGRTLTGDASASAARSTLELGSLATQSSINDSDWSGTDLAIGNGGTGASNASGARSNLGLGSLATQSSVNDSDWSGTDLAIGNGGTGASNASGARSNLGLGSAATEADTKYNHRSNNLSDVGNASTVRSNLGLGSLATQSSINNGDWSGTNLAIGNGGTGASNASGARSNLGLGSLATQSSINNGDWSGTNLAVGNGGTGASNASGARSNLGIGSMATRDVTISTSAPSGGSNGDIWFRY